MNPGTRVYYRNPEAQWKWRSDRGPKPEPEKRTGTVVNEPLRDRLGKWTCLVATDPEGRVVNMGVLRLYVVLRELAF